MAQRARKSAGVARWMAALLAAAALSGFAGMATAEPRHGLSAFGDLKYPADFTHFDYVNPDAPKGSAVRLWALDSFDSLNPFILKGVPADGLSLTYETLMARAMDEPDAVYGLVAETVELAADRSGVTFRLRSGARWHDGTPITAQDVAFSFKTLVEKGHPQFRILYRDVAEVDAVDRLTVRFAFKPGANRDLPLLIAQMPIVSAAYYGTRPFDQTALEPPLASGPYRIAKVEPGRSVTYERVPDHWGRDLPVNRGRFNFDRIRFDYYRDREIALQAFFAHEYDFREEFTSRAWATQYDTPAVRSGLVVRESLADNTPSGVQAFFFNLRRAKFQDARVRAAFDLAFDFHWTNRNLFYGLYRRTESMYENSELAAHHPPTEAEIALLDPLREIVPAEVFERPFAEPSPSTANDQRNNLRRAAQLLREAGWRVRDQRLVDAAGNPFTVEFLIFESSFERVIQPYLRNLERLGINGRIRVVDVANFKYRMDHFDFDIVIQRYVQPLTPGIEQRNYFGSAYADVPGSLNIGGIKDTAVDALIEKVIGAETRPELLTAVHALDRVLMWNRFTVPQWYNPYHNLAYWNIFGRPKTRPRYDVGMIDTWWIDVNRLEMIARGIVPPKPDETR